MGLFKKVYTWKEASNSECRSYRSLYQQETNKKYDKEGINNSGDIVGNISNNIPNSIIQNKQTKRNTKRNKTNSTSNNNSKSTTSNASIY